MTPFYKYQFISPSPLYAKIKEELKSYFETGMVDDLLFPVWTNDALRDLSKTTLPIADTILYLEDYCALLPSGFDSVREAWLCTNTAPVSIRKPGAYYSQVITLLNPDTDPCKDCDPCTPAFTELIYKATTDEIYSTKVSHLLKPGTISATAKCEQGCPNLASTSSDVFDIKDGKFHTNFRTGDVYLLYYSKDFDSNNYQLVPDNRKILEYVDAYIRCKIFYQLFNQTTDETYNQVRDKYQMAEAKKTEAYGSAYVEAVKHTIPQKAAALHRQNNRFRKYIIK